MNVKNYNTHTTTVLTIGVLAASCINLSFLKSANPILTFVLCGAATVVIAIVLPPIINRVFNRKGACVYVLSAIIVVLSFYGVVISLKDYISFLNTLDINKVAAILLLIAVLAALTFCSDSAFLKFALLFGVVTAFLVVLLFIMSAGIYDFFNIKLTPLKADFKIAATAFLKNLSAIAPTICFAALSNHKTNVKITSTGVGMGLTFVAFCLLQSLLVLGDTATKNNLPYLTAVSAYSSGQLYIRQDGFVWFMFFSTTTIKTALCLKVVWGIIKKIFKIRVKKSVASV